MAFPSPATPDLTAATRSDAGNVLVVDDEKAVRSALQVNLTRAGYTVTLAADGHEALERLALSPPDLILTDLRMPHIDGMVLLQSALAAHPNLPVVMMTGHGSVRDAVQAMQAGAADYIIKPVRKDELLLVLERALKARRLEQEVVRLREALDDRRRFERLIGSSAPMNQLYSLIDAVADSDALVLVTGPTGSGKELVSHALHARSGRKQGPFVALNCAALPEQLLESELFGHEKGSFTGAIRQHHGRFEQASGGTLLLDEIGEIPLATQVRLLRVLESGEVHRVGGNTPVRVNTRVVAATHRDLAAEVREGRFREDLYYRLNVFHIPVPPLSARRDDIPSLAEHFISVFAKRHNRPARSLSPEVLAALQAWHWPGNVRELAHVIERAVLLTQGRVIEKVDLQPAAPAPRGVAPPPLSTPLSTSLPSPRFDIAAFAHDDRPLTDLLQDVETRLIIDALKRAQGVQAEAARILGISRSNLHYRIKRLNIVLDNVEYVVTRDAPEAHSRHPSAKL